MKPTAILLLILLCFVLPGVSGEGLAPDPGRKVSDDMIEVLTQNLDNLFPITSMKQYFNEPEHALYSDDGMETVIEIANDQGKRNIRIFANADGEHDHMAYDAIDDGYPIDFQMTMDVTIHDTWPMGQGGCFVGFTSYGVSAFHDEDGAETIALLSDAKNTEIYFKTHDTASGEHFPLETRGRETMKLSILHLTGHTYVYIDNNYAGQLHDGLEGPFRMLYGAALFENGDSASCSFDNLAVRKLRVE